MLDLSFAHTQNLAELQHHKLTLSGAIKNVIVYIHVHRVRRIEHFLIATSAK